MVVRMSSQTQSLSIKESWHTQLDGRTFAVLAAFGFSLKAIFVKLAYAAAPVDASTLLALRMGIALPFFLWLARTPTDGQAAPLDRSTVGQVLLLGCLGYYLSSLFDFEGLRYISAGLERLILYIYPTLVLLLQTWFSKRKPSRGAWQAIACCYLGLAVAFAHDLRQTGTSADALIGAGWVLASAVTYALYYLGTGNVVGKLGSMRLTGLTGAASSLMVLAHWLLRGEPHQLLALPAQVWLDAALMALLSTVLPIWALAQAIRRMGAGEAAAIGSLGPVLTVAAAWWLLGEQLSLVQLAGLALVMFGVTRLSPAKPSKTQPAS